MGITCPPGGNTRDGKRKGEGDPSGITIRSEANLSARETVHVLECGISARFPSLPNAKRGLSFINVTRPFHTVFSVFFVATVSAITADNAVKSGANRGNRVFSFAENPDLDHVAGFPIVRRGFETRGDDDPGGIFVKEKAIAHREPPTINSATQ